jgi:hypothetical protein
LVSVRKSAIVIPPDKVQEGDMPEITDVDQPEIKGGGKPRIDVDPSELLTPAAKLAIRSYMIKVATPSAIILSVVSAILGFLLNEWARGEAYVKAYGDASRSVLDTATAAAVSRGQSDLLLTEIKESAKGVAALKEEITQKKIEVEDFLKKNFEGVAKVLLGDDKFKSSLARVDQEQFKVLETTVSDLKSNLLKSASDTRNLDGRIIKCPDGYYLIGFTFQDQPGLGHGALWGPSATCGRLNVGSVP